MPEAAKMSLSLSVDIWILDLVHINIGLLYYVKI